MESMGTELYCIQLNSGRDTNQGVINPDSSYLKADFNYQLNLNTSDHYTIALHKGVISNSWNTISEALDNNKFSIAGTVYTIPDGHHSVKTLNDYFASVTALVGIKVTPLYYNGKVEFQNSAAGVLTMGTLGKALGVPVGTVLSPSAYIQSDVPADFTGGVSQIKVECNLVDMRYTKDGTDGSRILHTCTPISTKDTPPWSFINIVEYAPHSVHMTNETSITQVEIKLLNQDGKQIFLNNTFSEFCVCIRLKRGLAPPLTPNYQI